MDEQRVYRVVLEGGGTPGEEIALTRLRTVIGRDARADIVVNVPAVSRQHACISQSDGQYILEDMGSSNGTYVNGELITGAVPIQPGDEIRLGQAVRLVVEGPAEREAVQEAQTLLLSPDKTLLVDDGDLEAEAASGPYLVVTVAGQKPERAPLTGDVITIGRAVDNDVVVDSPIVSRYQARLERADGGYRITPRPEAGNPLLLDGQPLAGPHRLHDGDLLRIGSHDPGLMITFAYHSPAEPRVLTDSLTVDLLEDTTITIGRDTDNDVVLDAPMVSRYHAEIERVGRRFRVRDLQSSNGTFVNDERLEGEAWVKPDDVIRVGLYRFVVGEEQLAQYDETGGLRVEAAGLNKWVRKDLNILQDISLVFQPREFIVVVGQSGGGKSTLIDAIAGYRPATHGKVFVNEVDVYRNFDAVRSNIGYVPQRDIIHMELTVYQALDYAARLRMPPDTTREERHQRIMDVLEDLDLAHRKDVQISGLSGGQQKRVSIGVELLTKPGLFFLDEPTSGLDPGTETALMHLMRRLADQGRTIVLVTHATKNVMLADKIVFLARGGYLAWFGPPDEALAYFDQYRSERERRTGEMQFDDIYAVLDDSSKGTPEVWAERYRAHAAYERYIAEALDREPPPAAEVEPAESRRASMFARPAAALRQFGILSSRNLRILTRDRFSLALMLAAAPVAAMLDVILAVLAGRAPFDFFTGDFFDVMRTSFILPLYGIMVGGLAMMREIVKEGEVYRRERLVNLQIVPYVSSKVWVAALLALYHSVVYVAVRYLAFDMPGGALEFGLIYVTMVMTTLAGMMVGLFASALAPNANSAPLIVILLMLPQIVLAGALVPLPQFISAPMPTRWGFEAMMGITGAGSDVAADTCWALPEETRLALTPEQKEDLSCRCLGSNTLDPESCNFPGLGIYYTPALDQEAPVEPPPLREEPAQPELPPRPEEPADQSDTVAMAEYFDALQAWEEEVNRLQSDYEAELQRYRAEAEVFQAQQVNFQTQLAEWQVARAAAIQPAEGVLGQAWADYNWTFVDKGDRPLFLRKIARAWLAQLAISAVLFGAILVLQKRKDVT